MFTADGWRDYEVLDTGGGEFLLSLHHPFQNTSATEGYPPNVQLCKETLLPLGIDFFCILVYYLVWLKY